MLARLTLPISGFVLLLASAAVAWPEDAPEAPSGAPSTDDLVAAIVFGTPEDVGRAAGWLRALSQERVEEVLMRLRRAAQTSAVTEALGSVRGTISGAGVGHGSRVELRRTRLDASAALRGLFSGNRTLESAVDGSGQYAIASVPPGPYEVVLLRDATAFSFANVVLTRDESVSADCVLDRTSVELGVRGDVDRGSEAPRVILIGAAASDRRFIAEPRLGERIVAVGLPAGAWDWTGTLDLVTSTTVSLQLSREPGARVELVLPEHGWIDVRLQGVVAAGSETIVIASPDGARNLIRQSSRDGRCRVAAPPGTWTVRRGHRGASTSVVVRGSATVRADL